MIEVKKMSCGVSIQGHAHYAEPGKDIVCAAVSTLVQSLIQSVEELCADPIEYVIQPGTVEIKHGNLTKEATLLLDSFFIGIRMIANEYPAFVRIV